MTHDQFTRAVREAPQYDSPDAFCSALLPSTDMTQADDLRKIWIAVAAPFRDFLAELGLTQTKLSRYFHVPLRTVQNWALGDRQCPSYVRLMMAELCGLIPKEEDLCER